MEVSLILKDELAVVFFWIGISGSIEYVLTYMSSENSRIYIYILLLMLGIYFKLD
jgi:hypothetical protein